MKEIDKELLIKDLSARIFYGVKVNIERDFPNNPQIVERIAKDGEIIVNGILAYDIYYYKPYLRPLSSMTEGERKEYESFIFTHHHEWDGYGTSTRYVEAVEAKRYIDWLIAHHFDYYGLIPMGLALEAKEGMYKID